MSSTIIKIESSIKEHLQQNFPKMKILMESSIDVNEIKQGFTAYIRFLSSSVISSKSKLSQDSMVERERKKRFELSYKVSIFYKDLRSDTKVVYELVEEIFSSLNLFKPIPEFVTSPLMLDSVEYVEKSPNNILQYDIICKIYATF